MEAHRESRATGREWLLAAVLAGALGVVAAAGTPAFGGAVGAAEGGPVAQATPPQTLALARQRPSARSSLPSRLRAAAADRRLAPPEGRAAGRTEGHVATQPIPPPAGVSTRFSSEPQRAQAVPAVHGVDFRRVGHGVGMLAVGLPEPHAGVRLRQHDHLLVLELPGMLLPERLRQRLEVAHFGTPVGQISARQQGADARIEVHLKHALVAYGARQADGQYLLEIREAEPVPFVAIPGRPGGAPSAVFSGEKLSLNFQNIEIRALLQVIADFSDFNIVASDAVQGSLTLRLRDVPWDQALQIILDSKELGQERNGNVLWIAPKDELDARRKKDFEARLALSRLEPLRTQSFQLNYARAEQVAEQLAGTGMGGGAHVAVADGAASNRFLTERGGAIAERRTNQLFVTDTPARLEDVARLVASWDVPVRQVMIEARIVEAVDNFSKTLGVRLGGGSTGSRLALGGNQEQVLAAAAGAGSSTLTNAFYSLPASAIGTYDPASFALAVFNATASRLLSLELSALEFTGDGRVIASPRIVTADQVEAAIEQGREIPYTSTAPNGATTIEFKKAVLRLGVTPQITPEGNVILALDVNKDSPNYEYGTIAIDTKKITTQVLVENGGTVVIGGIFELTEFTEETKVPLLGDLPVAGRLFKTTNRTTSRNELLVFVTPRILGEPGAALPSP